MVKIMQPNDPHMTPSPSIFSEELRQPYTRRLISTIFWIALFVVVAVFFAGWIFSGGRDDAQRLTQEQQVSSNMLNGAPAGQSSPQLDVPPVTAQTASAPSSPPAPIADAMPPAASTGGWMDALKNFMIGLGGATGGVDSNTPVYAGGNAPLVQQAVAEERANQLFDGKILDFEGKVAGDIEAVQYADNQAEMFTFRVKQELTPADKPRHYSVPKDEVKVVQDGTVFFIQLNEEQTRALAEALYTPEE